jgi:hypothetical protein
MPRALLLWNPPHQPPETGRSNIPHQTTVQGSRISITATKQTTKLFLIYGKQGVRTFPFFAVSSLFCSLFPASTSQSRTKINRKPKLLETPVSYRKQRIGLPINRKLSRGPRSPFSLFTFPFSDSNRNSPGIRIFRNTHIKNDIPISNRNTSDLSFVLPKGLPTPYPLNPAPYFSDRQLSRAPVSHFLFSNPCRPHLHQRIIAAQMISIPRKSRPRLRPTSR